MVSVEAPAEIPGRIAVRTDLYGSGPAGGHSPGNQCGTFRQNHKYSAFYHAVFSGQCEKRRYSAFELFLCTVGENAWALFSHVFLQLPDIFFNSIPAFGPLYHVSIPFVFVGIIVFTIQLFREKNIEKQTQMLALWGFLVTGIWVGLITYEVNINRVNIIFYPIILLCAYGIGLAVRKWKKLWPVVAAAYGISSILFFGTYFTTYAEESREYYNKDFMEAVAEADSLEEYESLYITGNLGWQFNRDATEILTQYVCKIDAQYYQGKSNVSNGRELPAYADRYHYIYPEQQATELVEMVGDGLLVLYQGDLQYIDFSYDVVDTVGDYLLLTVQN